MRLSITTDDLSFDFSAALEIVHEQQCREFELRGLGFDTIPDVDERWLVQAEKAVHHKRLRLTALAPRFFLETLPPLGAADKLFAIARRLKCNLVSIYGMKKPPEPESRDDEEDDDTIVLPSESMLDSMREFINAAAREQCQVALLPHPDTYAGTAAEALALIEALDIDKKILGLEWDVGACFAAGDDSGLDSLADVLPHLKAVRMRDAVRRGMGADWVSLGKGVLPWEDILELLYEGNYRGPVIVETGVAPKLREGRAALALAGRWIGACRINSRVPEKGDGDEDNDRDDESWKR